jgi:hypothetical protein
LITEEQQKFCQVLQSYLPGFFQKNLPTLTNPFRKSSREHHPTLLLFFHGGGMGKGTLLHRLRQIVEGSSHPEKADAAFKDQFNEVQVARCFFCNLKLYRQLPHQPLKLGDLLFMLGTHFTPLKNCIIAPFHEQEEYS